MGLEIIIQLIIYNYLGKNTNKFNNDKKKTV